MNLTVLEEIQRKFKTTLKKKQVEIKNKKKYEK